MMPDASEAILKPIVRHWFEQARPFMETQDFEITWFDFIAGWEKIKFLIGESPMDHIAESIKDRQPPPEAAMFDSANAKLLVAICAELQRQAGSDPFFLDCRTAGKLIEVDHMTAWRYLKIIQKTGVLVVTEKGSNGRATRWRYVPQS